MLWLPRDRWRGAPVLPQTLLFDEDYESHSFYEYRKARRWLASAKAVVFVGTSFAVGVTEHALQVRVRGPRSEITAGPARLPR